MNQRTRNFILKELIPFIEREEGRGFAMNEWHSDRLAVGAEIRFDGVPRKVPVCGMVCCIGGSCAVVAKRPDLFNATIRSTMELGKKLGLTTQEAHGLFYGWNVGEDAPYRWPLRFQADFVRARTTKGKAHVAVRLLLALTAKGGQILRRKDGAR